MNIYKLRFTEDGSSVGYNVTVKSDNKENAILAGLKKLSKREQERVDYCNVIEDVNNK